MKQEFFFNALIFLKVDLLKEEKQLPILNDRFSGSMARVPPHNKSLGNFLRSTSLFLDV